MKLVYMRIAQHHGMHGTYTLYEYDGAIGLSYTQDGNTQEIARFEDSQQGLEFLNEIIKLEQQTQTT